MSPGVENILRAFFALDPRVRFVYLFGSCARKEEGALSDIDLAVFLEEGVETFEYRLKSIEALCCQLKRDRVDLVLLKEASLILKYEVVKDGIVLKEDRPLRIEFEESVLREYLDMGHFRRVREHYLKERLTRGARNG